MTTRKKDRRDTSGVFRQYDVRASEVSAFMGRARRMGAVLASAPSRDRYAVTVFANPALHERLALSLLSLTPRPRVRGDDRRSAQA